MKRKTMMRRAAAGLLLLVLAFAFLPAAGAEEAAEEPSEEETLSDEMAERFGYNAVVETDEHGDSRQGTVFHELDGGSDPGGPGRNASPDPGE